VSPARSTHPHRASSATWMQGARPRPAMELLRSRAEAGFGPRQYVPSKHVGKATSTSAEGAVPKDAPARAVHQGAHAMVERPLTKIPVKETIAMTGDITFARAIRKNHRGLKGKALAGANSGGNQVSPSPEGPREGTCAEIPWKIRREFEDHPPSGTWDEVIRQAPAGSATRSSFFSASLPRSARTSPGAIPSA